MKRCRICGKVKPLEEFDKRKTGRDGHRTECHVCRQKDKLAYCERNREREAARARKWYAENQERASASRRKYYRENREAVIASSQKWAESNRKKSNGYKQKWAKANPEKMRECRTRWVKENPEKRQVINRRRKHREANVISNLSGDEWLMILEKYGHKCLCCGSTDNLTIDHVLPLSMGGALIAGNVQPLCGVCNSAKGPRFIDYRPDWWAQAT